MITRDPIIHGFPRCPDCGAALGTKGHCMECGMPRREYVGVNNVAVSDDDNCRRKTA